MRRPGIVFTLLSLMLAALASACGSSGRSTSGGQPSAAATKAAIALGSKLPSRIIAGPPLFTIDPTPHATGVMTPAVFEQAGGSEDAAKAGFLGGYKVNYLDPTAPDALTITVIEFSSASDAARYFAATAPNELSYAGAVEKADPHIPGAVSVVGTKAYGGEYSQGVVMSRGKFYASVIYVNQFRGTAPAELTTWALREYGLLG
jgi:hypothetical protein